jgi:hypothetical protein
VASLVPRRPRPPITAREIGAWLCGRRAAKVLDGAILTYPELETLALTYSLEDSPIAASMRLSDYVRWFIRGYESKTDGIS